MCHIQSTTNDLMTAYKFLDESRALFNMTVKHDKFASLWDSLKCLQRSEDYGNAFGNGSHRDVLLCGHFTQQINNSP